MWVFHPSMIFRIHWICEQTCDLYFSCNYNRHKLTDGQVLRRDTERTPAVVSVKRFLSVLAEVALDVNKS